jgi:Putative transposase
VRLVQVARSSNGTVRRPLVSLSSWSITVAGLLTRGQVDLDPLSLLCGLVALVPAPRFHTVRYSGVLAPASKWRPFIVPKPAPTETTHQRSAVLQPAAGVRGQFSLPAVGQSTSATSSNAAASAGGCSSLQIPDLARRRVPAAHALSPVPPLGFAAEAWYVGQTGEG